MHKINGHRLADILYQLGQVNARLFNHSVHLSSRRNSRPRRPRRRALWVSFIWGCAGLTIIYALGATWLAANTQLPFAAALAQGVLPFVPFDLIKVALAALVASATAPAIASSRA